MIWIRDYVLYAALLAIPEKKNSEPEAALVNAKAILQSGTTSIII